MSQFLGFLKLCKKSIRNHLNLGESVAGPGT